MKPLALLFALLFAGTLSAGPQSVLPVRTPVYCQQPARGFLGSTCRYPYTIAGTTGIVIARDDPDGFKDSQGNAWAKDVCVSYNHNCIYHAALNVPNNQGDTLIFPPGEGFDAVLMMYPGKWSFDQGNVGTYDTENYPFTVSSGCTNGQDCPYGWTQPIEVNAGELLIEWGDANVSGPGIAIPGAGFNTEFNNGIFTVADMLAPVPGTYIGSMFWENADGSPGGGSHWLLGIAAYIQVTQ